MPGPSNSRKNKGKFRGKGSKRPSGNLARPAPVDQPPAVHKHPSPSSTPSLPSSPSLRTPSPLDKEIVNSFEGFSLEAHIPQKVEQVMFQPPFIHDPGNGPRVRDARIFMSSFFAKPAALDDPLCAEFAQEEVLQMLCTVLPEETALILWYNKSRAESRICPACQRLYRLGDHLPDLIDEESTEDKPPSPQLLREQRISGLCSPVCFIMASFNFPSVIKSAWGRMGDEMDDTTWDLLNDPVEGDTTNDTSRTLGMLVRMTRLHDLGLAQLCFDAEEASMLEMADEQLEVESS